MGICGHGMALLLRVAACPYSHTRAFGAPGSHGVWLIPLPPSPACDLGPGCPGLGWPTWFEHLRIVRGWLLASLSGFSWVLFCSHTHCDLTTAACFFPCSTWQVYSCLRPLWILLLLPGTPFPSSFHTGSFLSVKSRLKCHLLRGAFPDLSMQSNSFFHFLSYYYYIYF